MNITVQIDSVPYMTKPTGAEIGGIKQRLCSSAPISLTLEDFAGWISSGYSFTPAVLSGGAKAENWKNQQLFCLDIDNEDKNISGKHNKQRAADPLTPERVIERCTSWGIKPALIYETLSSSPQWQKFRIVFVSGSTISDYKQAENIRSGLIEFFPESDKACKNADRLFYGGKNVLHIDPAAVLTEDNLTAIEHFGAFCEFSSKYSSNDGGELEKLKREFDFLGYIRKLGGAEKSAGNRILFNPCPICGHNDDFWFYTETNSFMCFGANGNVGGSIIDFIMRRENMDKKAAIKYFKYTLCGIDEECDRADYHAKAVNRLLKTNQPLIEKLTELNPLSYHYSDRGSSELFADMFCHELRYNTTAKEWYFYNGKVWKLDNGSMYAHSRAKQFFDALIQYSVTINDEKQRKQFYDYYLKFGSKNKRNTLIKDAADCYCISSEELDTDPNLFNCQNGTFELDTMRFREHRAEDFITKISNVTYDNNANYATWEKFINEVLPYDNEKVRYLQKALGYSLMGDNNLEQCYILYGATTRNGKSTLVGTMVHMLGSTDGYARSAQPEVLAIRKNRDSRAPSEDLARLAGCRFLNVSEPPQSMAFDVALLKTLTGKDPITARFLNQNSFEFVPQFKLFINTNYLPKVLDETLFKSNRVNVIEFNRHFELHEQDETLKDRLQSEENISGLFNWCLEGLKAFRTEGLKLPMSVAASTAAYEEQSDKLGNFISECFEEAPGKYCSAKYAYEVYKTWCAESGYYAEGKQKFFEMLRSKNLLAVSGTVCEKTVRNVICNYIINAQTSYPNNVF